MSTAQVISGSIVSAAALVMIIYVSFTARGKGPILSNTYLWLSEEERKKADKKSEYRLVTVIFGGLALSFAFLAVYIFTQLVWSYVLMWIAVGGVVVYAVADSVRTIRKKKD